MTADYSLRNVCKRTANLIGLVVVSPLVLICNLEALRGEGYHRIFSGCSQFLAIIPGLTGMCLRRAFYRGTLRGFGWNSLIGFGVIIGKRESLIEENVWIGNYALLGSVIIREGSLIGSRCSILSQGTQHVLDHQGRWTTPEDRKLDPTEIGAYSWIGEGTIILANIGKGSQVAAGSVVSSEVPPHIMVAGNPARFVKRLFDENPTS
jgi:virginiamycin A acetyltransferase